MVLSNSRSAADVYQSVQAGNESMFGTDGMSPFSRYSLITDEELQIAFGSDWQKYKPEVQNMINDINDVLKDFEELGK